MSERNTAPQAPDQGETRSFLSPAAIIVAALAAATTALLRPIVEASTENAVLVAVLLSVATTTSTAVYKAGVEKITQGYRGRRWRPPLFAGLLAGLAACLLGISVVSGAELAILGKEPSISPNGTSIIPYIVGGPPPSGQLISYYRDEDGDGVGAGPPAGPPTQQYKRGSQPPGWVEKGGDKCPDTKGLLQYEGCLTPPGQLISYYEDTDRDGVGAGPRMQYTRDSQPPGLVERSGDNCPFVSNPDQKDTNVNGLGDACEPPR
jgi:hypothetical protein